EAREEADRRAKKIVSIAIERLAGEFVAERTVSVVTLPSDDMKGRIIGREGRNIRAIEAATGVDLIIDDTPEAVVISCHNPIRRELARRAALLHDIGKALTHEVEGSHAIIGGEIARKYGESAKIVNAIAAHHEEVKAETILAPLVDAADALSGARPGARREVLESYAK